jgi:lipopolysaccharide/colanic/teichoic acid biosynthesis glycosyltransferase
MPAQMKRAVDLIFAAVGLIVLAPLMGGIALVIKLCDWGTVFFAQERVGQFGVPFRMYKFRTMVANAERLGIPLTTGNDPRITRVGRWLRRTKLDELPQLWNVVKGDMSLVGPRPEVPRYVALYTAEQRYVLNVRPGITDPASLQFFDEARCLAMPNPEMAYVKLVLPHKLAINLAYLRRRTVVSDFIVLLATLRKLIAPGSPSVSISSVIDSERQSA